MFALDDALIMSIGGLLLGVISKMIHSKFKKSKCRGQLGDNINFSVSIDDKKKEEESKE